LLNKGLSLATALFVTKFIEKIAKNFDTLWCAALVWLRCSTKPPMMFCWTYRLDVTQENVTKIIILDIYILVTPKAQSYVWTFVWQTSIWGRFIEHLSQTWVAQLHATKFIVMVVLNLVTCKVEAKLRLFKNNQPLNKAVSLNLRPFNV
jgi:hypothetical protein